MNKNFYNVLGVNENSSNDEIKKAYRKLSLQHHPDKNNGKDEKFKEINEAYETLKDPSKKRDYDAQRNMRNNMGGMRGMGGMGGMGGMEGMEGSMRAGNQNVDGPSGLPDNNMAEFNPTVDNDIIKKNINKKSMNGPQGVETLLETLSSNTKPVIITNKKNKKGLNL